MPAHHAESKEPAAYGMVRTPVNREGYEDRYVSKLLKYIPAEVLAAFIPLVALAEGIGSDFWVWLTIGIGALAVIGYSRWQATDVLRSQIEKAHGPESKHPRSRQWRDREYEHTKPYPYYYPLAVVAFAAWALATASPVRSVVGFGASEAEYIVAAVAFLLPLADVTLKHFATWLATIRLAHPARPADR